jgi:hypothetical protein
MSLTEKSAELRRLIEAFEEEAGKFHDIQLHTCYVIQGKNAGLAERRFAEPNHAIMLWQYYGILESKQDINQLMENVTNSDLQWGLRGSTLTCFGVLEGNGTPLFVRMAMRAGSLFSPEESVYIKSRVVFEIQERETSSSVVGKPTAAVNDNPLAIWLNFLLYHLSLAYPSRERARKIEPDPYSLSLLALERLMADRVVGKIDRSSTALANHRFKVGLSFPGEKRRYVSKVADALRVALGEDSVFYDYDYQAQLARPNLDTLLQRIYRDQSELIVVFLCAAYAEKEWCGLEWRVVRDIIKSKADDRIMFVRFDDARLDGLLSIDGYVDGNARTSKQVAAYIVERITEFEKRG